MMLTPPAPYQLRPMNEGDLTAVYNIDRLSFPTPARTGIFEHELNTNDLAHFQVLCAQTGVIGYAGYWLIADEVHIITIAVHPQWRRRYGGELLLLNILFLAYSHPANMVTLEVRHGNQVAQALYRKYRFLQTGKRRRYYKDTGEDALLMTAPALDASYHQFLVARREDLYERLISEVSRP